MCACTYVSNAHAHTSFYRHAAHLMRAFVSTTEKRYYVRSSVRVFGSFSTVRETFRGGFEARDHFLVRPSPDLLGRLHGFARFRTRPNRTFPRFFPFIERVLVFLRFVASLSRLTRLPPFTFSYNIVNRVFLFLFFRRMICD